MECPEANIMDDELSVFLCLGLWSRYHSEAATIPSAQNKGTIWYDSYSMVQGACDFLLVSKSTLLTLLAAKAQCPGASSGRFATEDGGRDGCWCILNGILVCAVKACNFEHANQGLFVIRTYQNSLNVWYPLVVYSEFSH